MAPIHGAARNGNLNRVKALLNQGVPVNARNEYNWTPLHHAARRGHLSIVQELLRRGARVNIRTHQGSTPLDVAAFARHFHVVHALQEAGARPRMSNNNANTGPVLIHAGNTVEMQLRRAVDRGNIERIRLLQRAAALSRTRIPPNLNADARRVLERPRNNRSPPRAPPQRRRRLMGIPAYNNFNFNNSDGNNVLGSPPVAAARAPNYSKASKHLKKWLEARPHEIRMNQVNVKLPMGASDPISLKNFNKGNEAIMILKKDVRNGALRTKRYFLEKNTLARLARKPWRSILRMKASDAVFRDPINRRTVYRRNLMNVKFI